MRKERGVEGRIEKAPVLILCLTTNKKSIVCFLLVLGM